jgi:hypothetical protein
MPSNTLPAQIGTINQGIESTYLGFESFVNAVARETQSRGFSVQYRIDKTVAGIGTPFSTNASAQVDVSKDGYTARSAITYFHWSSQSVSQVSRMLVNAWVSKVNFSGSTEFVGGNPVTVDPITRPEQGAVGSVLPGSVSTTSIVFIGTPQSNTANRPGVSNTTVPAGSVPLETNVQSPSPDNSPPASEVDTGTPDQGIGVTDSVQDFLDRIRNGETTGNDVLIIMVISGIALYFILRS